MSAATTDLRTHRPLPLRRPATAVAWFVVTNLWLVDLCGRAAAQAQVLVGGRTLLLLAVALVAGAGWGALVGAGRAWGLLLASAGAGLAAAALGAVAWAAITFGVASEVDPESLWVVVAVLTVGVWAVLTAVLVLAAAAGERLARR